MARTRTARVIAVAAALPFAAALFTGVAQGRQRRLRDGWVELGGDESDGNRCRGQQLR